MRSNAGMANRQGDVDLRFAFKSPPPVSTLAWLGLAWLGLAWLGLAWFGNIRVCK
jgi:hypothetical protein